MDYFLPPPAPDALGGYFGLELPLADRFLHSKALSFQSARAAFSALLKVQKPTLLWLPYSLCDSIMKVAQSYDIRLAFYRLDEYLMPEFFPVLRHDEWFFYVNYFGLCDRNVHMVLHQLPPKQVIIDNAQALFTPPHQDALATLYSPRKFVGIPDGGYIYSHLHIPPSGRMDHDSILRCRHLLTRISYGAEAGYADFVTAEQTLEDHTPLQMSPLTKRMISNIDFSHIIEQRRQNFDFLKNAIPPLGDWYFDDHPEAVPLCYPLPLAGDDNLHIRLLLREHRIYLPIYWSHSCYNDAQQLTAFLPLPCDQRYTHIHLARMATLVNSLYRSASS
jgi:hypothetical protein